MFRQAIIQALLVFTLLTSISDALSEEVKDHQQKKAATEKVQTLKLDQLTLKAIKIEVKINGQGKHVVNLEGQAQLFADQVSIQADSINTTFYMPSSLHVEMKGNVELVSSEFQLKAKAQEGEFNSSEKSFVFKGSEEGKVRLSRSHGARVIQIVATEIQTHFSGQEMALLKASGPVEMSERKPTQVDDFSVPQTAKPRNFLAPQIKTGSQKTKSQANKFEFFSEPKKAGKQYFGNYPFTK